MMELDWLHMVDKIALRKIWRQLISEQLKLHRYKRNLFQKEIAERVHCDELHYGRIERGDKLPSAHLLALILAELEIDANKLNQLYKERVEEYFRRYQ